MKIKTQLFVIVLSIIFLFISTINAQQSIAYYSVCNFKAGSQTHRHYTPPSSVFMKRSKTSEFEITFVNSNPDMEEAVKYAANIWSHILVSDVPVKVLVTFNPLPGFLGQCVPNIVKGFDGSSNDDIWYTSSLADAISGQNQKPDEYDMDIFISSQTPWYSGTDGKTGSDQFDLVTVVLHEMGHGLGYISFGSVKHGIGSYGLLTSSDLQRPIAFPFPDLEGCPTNYDKHLVDTGNLLFTDTTFYSNSSAELGELFTSNKLYFYGENADKANSNKPVKLFAASQFILASSILHLDENTFPISSGNELMTPYSDYGEANHDPGRITLGLLKDLGWEINDSVTAGVKNVNEKVPSSFLLLQNYPNPFNPATNIEYQIASTQNVELDIYDILGNKVVTLIDEIKTPGTYNVQFDAASVKNGLPSGIYFYILRAGNKFKSTRKMLLLK